MTDTPRRRALIVGIDTYARPGRSADSPPAAVRGGAAARSTYTDLEGSVRDARAVRQALLGHFGFRPEEVRLLLDSEATRAALLAGLEELGAGAGPGDELFFYFAGHGSQVFNSLSDENDQLDESLVPADAAAGAPDLRDKELHRIANRLLDRGARLTVVLDCCHSSSALRGLPVVGGRTRRLPADVQDVADPPDPGPKPEERGALVLAATQADQPAYEDADEQGQVHGAFTLALLRALAQGSPAEPAFWLFLRAKALLWGARARQEPSFAGRPERHAEPLLARAGEALPVRPPATVRHVWPNGTVILQGGVESLGAGCELTAPAADGSLVRLRVTAVRDPGTAEAEAFAGDPKGLAPGALCTLTAWRVAGGPTLPIWIPEYRGPWEEVMGLAAALRQRAEGAGARWIDDPLAETPALVLAWSGRTWQLTAAGAVRDCGPRPDADEVLGEIRALAAEAPRTDGSEPGLFVHLPAPACLVSALHIGAGTDHDTVERLAGPAGASYLLVGRLRVGPFGGARAEFAWIRPGMGEGDNDPLPARGEWHCLPQPGMRGGGPAAPALHLRGGALRLARLRSWLTLGAPPAELPYPYRLALRLSDGALRTGGTLRLGEPYGLVLHARTEDLRGHVEPRYVYVFQLNSYGRIRLFFPPPSRGGAENRFPLDRQGLEPWPERIPLGTQPGFHAQEPVGVDTFFLLTTTQPIAAPEILEAEGVRRGTGCRTALEELLVGRSDPRRGPPMIVPADWSLEKLTVVTSSSLP